MQVRRSWKPHPQWYFTLIMVAIFAWGVVEALRWPLKTQLFPLAVAIPMLGLALVQLTRDLRGKEVKANSSSALPADGGISPGTVAEASAATSVTASDPISQEITLADASSTDLAKVTAELLAYFAGVYVLGFLEVIPVFTALYLRFEAKEPWWRAIAIGLIVWAFTWALFIQVLHLPFPTGVIAKLISPIP